MGRESEALTLAIFLGVPSFVKALVFEGKHRVAGHELARHTYAEISSMEGDAEEAFETLYEAASQGERETVGEWYKDRFPGVWAILADEDARQEFVEGVLSAWDEGLMDA